MTSRATTLEEFETDFSKLSTEESRQRGLAFRSTIRATHQGDLFGIAPTGKQITVGLVNMIHLEMENSLNNDLSDLVQRLGAEISVKQLSQ